MESDQIGTMCLHSSLLLLQGVPANNIVLCLKEWEGAKLYRRNQEGFGLLEVLDLEDYGQISGATDLQCRKGEGKEARAAI